jgi:uncharacterized C2H2 Zn-finger protein
MKTQTRIFILVAVVSMMFLGGCASVGSRSGSMVTVDYKCPVCDSGFLTEAEWAEHVKHHGSSAVGAVVKTVKSKNHVPAIQYECPVCDTGFISVAEWQEHMARNHVGKKAIAPEVRIKKVLNVDQSAYTLYACPVCDTGFMSESEWQEHVKLNHIK